jgi:peptidoglycan/xylan/chitin deacetylase (PgdA/CDA1 family)
MTHPDLTAISHDQIKAELVESKQQFEILLERPVEKLALPYGAYNQAVLAMAKDVGYKRIYTLDPRMVGFDVGNLVLGRFSMSPDAWKIEFMLTCAGMYAWLGPWRQFIRWLKGLIYKFRN